MPQGTAQIYQWFTERSANIPPGSYSAQDHTTELEYGLTDNLQASLYVNYSGHQIRGYADGDSDKAAEDAKVDSFGRDRKDYLRFSGFNMALKYNILSPYKGSGWGLALYVEPGYSSRSRISGERQEQYSLENRIILHKNFLEDRLVWNVNFGTEFEKAQLSETGNGMQTGQWDDDEFRWTINSGLSYLVKPNWYAGIESRYIFECDNTNPQKKFAQFDNYNNCPERRILFFGPSVHYTTHKWWITATWLPQIYGRPATNGNLYLIERQRNEYRIKIAYNF